MPDLEFTSLEGSVSPIASRVLEALYCPPTAPFEFELAETSAHVSNGSPSTAGAWCYVACKCDMSDDSFKLFVRRTRNAVGCSSPGHSHSPRQKGLPAACDTLATLFIAASSQAQNPHSPEQYCSPCDSISFPSCPFPPYAPSPARNRPVGYTLYVSTSTRLGGREMLALLHERLLIGINNRLLPHQIHLARL